ncbi:MAG TPA: hypothetical protein PKK61_06835 [Defluviitaleaceae bacterium]|nr:hypothetical protein [Defluviitaleaceae bacterium]
MGRFAKLNNDIQQLGLKMLENQDICKLIYYPDSQIIDKPDVDADEILHKRLFLFTSKLPLAAEQGTYVMIRPYRFRPSGGGHFIISLLCFDIYTHQDARRIVFKDSKGELLSGDRILMIMDKIDEFMNGNGIGISINKDNLDGSSEVESRNAEFAGFTLAYRDISFR